MLRSTYFTQNYAGIICQGLQGGHRIAYPSRGSCQTEGTSLDVQQGIVYKDRAYSKQVPPRVHYHGTINETDPEIIQKVHQLSINGLILKSIFSWPDL